MNIKKVNAGVWIDASKELPEGTDMYFCKCDLIQSNGDDEWITQHGFMQLSYFYSETKIWHVNSNRITVVEWLKPVEGYFFTEQEIKNIWNASLNYYKSEYKMEKDGDNQMKPQPNFEQFLQSINQQ